MNHSDEIDAELENRLHLWACFLYELLHNRVGWSKQSPMVTALEVGVFTPVFGSKTPFTNPNEMEIDLIVNLLAKKSPHTAQALMLYYFYPNEPLRAIAHPLRISVSTLKSRVFEAKAFISGALMRMKREEEIRQELRDKIA